MAYKIISTGRSGPDGTVMQFICDFVSDVASLPTGENGVTYTKLDMVPAPGSTAIVNESKELYDLPPSRTWSPLLVFPQ